MTTYGLSRSGAIRQMIPPGSEVPTINICGCRRWVGQKEGKMRELLGVAIFAFLMGIGLGALEHHDDARARIVLGVYVFLTAVGAVAAVYYVWGKKK
jgi:hypothetical protein